MIEVLEKQYILKFEESRDLFVGYGKSDITGPISQVNLMGFVTPTQTATGMHGTILHRFFVILFENYFIFELKNQLNVGIYTFNCYNKIILKLILGTPGR